MSKQKDLLHIGEVYGSMLNHVKHKLVKEGKTGKEEIGEAPLQDGGPTEKSGFVKPKLDK